MYINTHFICTNYPKKQHISYVLHTAAAIVATKGAGCDADCAAAARAR